MKLHLAELTSGFLLCSTLACAHAVPKELTDAREAYLHTSSGPANTLTPAEVHKARVSLDVAEKSFSDDPEAQKTRDLAYVAQRKAQLADALALQTQDNIDKAAADQALQAKQAQLQKDTSAQLANAEDRISADGRRHDKDTDKLNAERLARQAAEQKAGFAEQKTSDAEQRTSVAEQKTSAAEQKTSDAEAKTSDAEARNKDLERRFAKLAAFKEEERGLVLTLSGSVLFTSNQATLLVSAENRLNQISEALIAAGNRSLLVEGYTDSRGQDSYNLDLSQRRADAVRSYIVSRGYPGDKIRASGQGKNRPIADNGNAEGRANNRRVEIVVLPK